jgi:hypothetical protein
MDGGGERAGIGTGHKTLEVEVYHGKQIRAATPARHAFMPGSTGLGGMVVYHAGGDVFSSVRSHHAGKLSGLSHTISTCAELVRAGGFQHWLSADE